MKKRVNHAANMCTWSNGILSMTAAITILEKYGSLAHNYIKRSVRVATISQVSYMRKKGDLN
jgi:hypothetical protein